MKRQIIGGLCLLISVALFALVGYRNSARRAIPIVFSPKNMVDSLWRVYVNDNLEPDTSRTLDKSRGNITTSEGESYTMLRAVWVDDKETFDKSFQWTKDNLQHDDDKLFAWLFGRQSDGSYGILTDQNGNNSASDADLDIALALIFAWSRWQEDKYFYDAVPLIRNIWDKEVMIINGKPYLLANDVEKISTSQTAVINPSYFSPATFRILAEVDPDHPWMKLVDTSYEVLEATSKSNLDKTKSVGLPPDWVTIHKTTGELLPSNNPALETNFGFDALRIPWRIALDWQWNKEARALNYLKKLSFLSFQWRAKGRLNTTYSHSGAVVTVDEAPSMYGGTIGYFLVADEKSAEEVYQKKLASLYNADTRDWKNEMSYYDDNWAWFGITLYNNMLPNLYLKK